MAAFDIAKALQTADRPDVKVLCYSFGAPRTGNHAFAAEYDRLVPDTWSVINDQVGARPTLLTMSTGDTARWESASSLLFGLLCVLGHTPSQNRILIAGQGSALPAG